MSFTKVGRFSTIISLIIFLVPHLPLLLLPWLYGSFIIDPQVPESLFIIFQSILCSSDCLQVQWFYLLSSLIYCCTIQWGFKFWMLYFSVLQFSFDPFFIMFFFAETFFMCFQVICNLLLKCFYASSVQFSRSVMSGSLRPRGLQHARLPVPTPAPRACSNSCPSSWWCHPTKLSSVSFSSCLHSFLASGSFQWVSSLHQVAKVLELQLQHQSFPWIFRTDFLLDGLVGSPCCPRDSQESSPTQQFKSVLVWVVELKGSLASDIVSHFFRSQWLHLSLNFYVQAIQHWI